MICGSARVFKADTLVMRLSIIAFWCFLLAFLICVWGWIENSWAAGFEGSHQAAFAGRAVWFFRLMVGTMAAAIILGWKWMRGRARRT